MKLTFVILLAAILQSFADLSYSQTTTLSLNLKKVQVQTVLEEIEDMSEFYFLYSRSVVNVDRNVDVEVKNARIGEVLDVLFNGSDVAYKVDGRQIVLSKSETPSALKADQQKTIYGKVTDSAGLPLPGVSIVVKGTAVGVVTNAEGNYSFAAPSDGAVLVFSFIGMKTQEVTIGSQSVINITLREDVVGVDEVVVIGYGTRKKSDLTGSVSQISADDLTKEVKMSPELAMQGKMAGVYISNPGSDPTARPTVRIRGVGTLGFNDPLYVVDGIPLTEGGASTGSAGLQDMRTSINVFSMINPNDIESISVLKDASATAIYGVRASNGVILIQTKRGVEGKPKVNFSASYGIQNINKRYDVMSVQDYTAAHLEAWANNPSVTPSAKFFRFYNSKDAQYLGNSPSYTNDWVNAGLVKNAAVQDYNVNISGGSKMSTYSFGSGYTSQENAVSYGKFDRYSFFMNSDHRIAKWLKVGESYRFMYSKKDTKGGTGGVSAAFNAPWQPVYDNTANGLNGWALPGRTINGTFQSFGYGNSTRDTPGRYDYTVNNFNIQRNLGTFYAEINPVRDLRIKGTVSFDYSTNTNESFSDMRRGLFEAQKGTLYDTNGNIYTKRDNVNVNIVKELLVGYTKSLGNNNLDLVFNAMDQRVNWILEQKSLNNHSTIPSWEQRRIDEGWPNADKGLFVNRMPSGLQGYMGRLSYNYDRKYYLDATVRRDGTSKFGPGYKWGTFPSFAAAWRISSEKFMESFTLLNDLKLRTGWGQTGNQETRDFAYLSLVNFNPKYALGSAGTVAGEGNIVPGAALGDFPIVDMSWETSTNFNAGIDAVFFNSKMTFTTDYYHRTTDGILQTIDIPWVIGALTNPVVNLATVVNSGFEFQLSYAHKIGEFGYNVSANLTTVNNKVDKLYRNRPSENNDLRIEEGYSMNYIFGYKTDGIFQTTQEVTDWLAVTNDPGRTSKKAPGDVRFVDLNGAPSDADGEDAYVHYEPDGKIDSYDRTYLGKTIPGYYYGFNLELSYNTWDASMNFRGVGDVQRVNTNGKLSIGAGGANFVNEYKNRWTATNPSNTIPRAIEGDPSGNNRISDRMVEEAGFLRFQNLQVGYSLKGGVINKIGANNLRCYVSGSNLLVVTPYTGLDPENDTTPVTFTMGVNVNF
ncbi:MAG TPA: TonB-dependent receptor [Prolixibacteraceae bacterium]|nr:TonB-dependent receptor [Prolixibacteraceae bacterium]